MSLIDELRRLPPKERVKVIRELQEKKKKELEEAEKRAKKEVEEVETALKDSIEDLTEVEEKNAEEQALKLRDQLLFLEQEEHNLEDTINEEEINNNNNNQTEYKTGTGYTPINQIVDDLNTLQYSNSWGQKEENLYQRRKEELQQTGQYKNTLSDNLVEQLSTAEQILKKMGYKH